MTPSLQGLLTRDQLEEYVYGAHPCQRAVLDNDAALRAVAVWALEKYILERAYFYDLAMYCNDDRRITQDGGIMLWLTEQFTVDSQHAKAALDRLKGAPSDSN